MDVLVRGFRGQPLRRTWVGKLGHSVLVIHPDRTRDLSDSRLGAVGFPEGDVFVFDPELYNRLDAIWDAIGSTDPENWSEAIPFSP